jgi:(1->4)-alpha-D-glucan 1-alpha-D-glucosylmutase
VSTYRLQLQPGFGFADAAEIAGYLASPGVSHIYLSPVLQAAPGSRHGYEVVDHSRISAELGGEPAFRDMVARFREHRLGVIADIVPITPTWPPRCSAGPPAPPVISESASFAPRTRD